MKVQIRQTFLFEHNPRLLGKSVGSKLCPRLSSDKFFNSKYSRFFNAWSSTLFTCDVFN